MDQSSPAAPTPSEPPQNQNDPAATPPANPDSDADALETPEGGAGGAPAPDAGSPAPQKPKGPSGIKGLLQRFNLYFLLFIFIIVMAGALMGIAYLQSKKSNNSGSIKSQGLSDSALQQIAESDATIGSPKQVLNVEANAVFAGKVLVRDSLELAGGLQVSGTVSLDGISVTGDATLQQAEISKNLSVGANAAIQGQATVGQSLQVNGTGTFNGAVSAPQVTTSSLQLNGDLTLDHHIVAGGPSPSRSNGPALGSGGTAAVSGSDTSGAISINTGSSPGAGCFITVNFTSKYASTPHVLITPVGSSAGGLAYYVDRSTSSFSICDASVPPAGASFGFDYFVVD